MKAVASRGLAQTCEISLCELWTDTETLVLLPRPVLCRDFKQQVVRCLC